MPMSGWGGGEGAKDLVGRRYDVPVLIRLTHIRLTHPPHPRIAVAVVSDVSPDQDLVGRRYDVLVSVAFARGISKQYDNEVFVRFELPQVTIIHTITVCIYSLTRRRCSRCWCGSSRAAGRDRPNKGGADGAYVVV
jgi:hypothetical protein